MSKPPTDVARLIESIIGKDHVIIAPELQIDGLRPALLARPGSAKEVADCLRVCAEAKVSVVPAGRMSWLECGNPLRRADVVLSLERMNRIIDYSPPDLTATVEAGLTLNDFNALTNRERQWLPFDAPGSGAASLGAIVSCNASGALRLSFGTPRDYVIGLKLAHADGSESKSGGRVVKNVAGYDMNKLYVGSYGTLAVMTELTFKLRPLPERAATMLVTSKDRGTLFLLAKRLMTSEMLPASIVLTNRLRPEIEAPPSGDNALFIRFMDNEAAVNHQIEWAQRAMDEQCTARILDEPESATFWMRMNNVQEQAKNTLRISVPLAQVSARYEEILLAHFGCIATADIGTGMIRMAFDADDDAAINLIKRLRSREVSALGSVIIEQAAPVVRRQADAWGEIGATASLMQSIKAKFDPQSMLNPGRFVAGI